VGARSHPFVGRNERTAAVVSETFLMLAATTWMPPMPTSYSLFSLAVGASAERPGRAVPWRDRDQLKIRGNLRDSW